MKIPTMELNIKPCCQLVRFEHTPQHTAEKLTTYCVYLKKKKKSKVSGWFCTTSAD